MQRKKTHEFIVKTIYRAINLITFLVIILVLFSSIYISFVVFRKFVFNTSLCKNMSEFQPENCSVFDFSNFIPCVKNDFCAFSFLGFGTMVSFIISFNVVFPIIYKLKNLTLKLEHIWGVSVNKVMKTDSLIKKHITLSFKERFLLNLKLLMKFLIYFTIVFLMFVLYQLSGLNLLFSRWHYEKTTCCNQFCKKS